MDRSPMDTEIDPRPVDVIGPGRPITVALVRAAIEVLPDPELPVVTIGELGILGDVEVAADGVRVALHPTFVACPATELIRTAVAGRLAEVCPGLAADVALVFDPPWTSDRITKAGRAKLTEAGIAPPGSSGSGGPLSLDVPVPCPFCGSRRTRLENLFGPTLCRAIYHCADCRQPFETLKMI